MATKSDRMRVRDIQDPFLIPARIFGFLLIFAFTVKCCGGFVYERISSDPLFVASAILDLTFGCFLVLSSSSAMFLAGALLFGTYSAFQLYSTFVGGVDCACMGKFKLPPAVWLIVDVSASAYFALMSVIHRYHGRSAPLKAIESLLLAVALCAVFAMAYVLNPFESVLEQSSVVSAERITNSWCRITIALQNTSDETIDVVGAKDTCLCRIFRSQVVVLAPGKKEELQFFVRAKEGDRYVEGTLPLFVKSSSNVKSFELQSFARIDS